MTLQEACSSLRGWTRRVWGALSGRRTDHDLQRELAGHLALAEDELRRKGNAPSDAARLARATAGGRIQALEALREQRGLPWLGSSCPPGEEPWVFVDIEGRDVPTEAFNGRLPGFPARFNQVDAFYFPGLSGADPDRPRIRRGRRRGGGRGGHRQPQLRRHHRPRRQRARTPVPVRPGDGRRVAGRPGSGPLV
jgi:hypothetical protein